MPGRLLNRQVIGNRCSVKNQQLCLQLLRCLQKMAVDGKPVLQSTRVVGKKVEGFAVGGKRVD